MDLCGKGMVLSRREKLGEIVEDIDRVVLDKWGFIMFDFIGVSDLLFVSKVFWI